MRWAAEERALFGLSPESPRNRFPCSVLVWNTSRGWFRRTKYVVRAGELKHFTADHDPEQFLHECMHEIASLTNLTYPFEKGEPSI